ncbi:aldo/keto reductase [Heliobacterium chlorum]|uniref:Aldo/keto reductase n=1 Tax=Heliobacterium chlorum TaxID=2698 RepID=A0ABR7SWQ8_HELCL|nr:aldo/keto reductase [Heliobacterium chlorum]MBC9782896.1 aldo/keto reductase [Heliobacterium chlorum]
MRKGAATFEGTRRYAHCHPSLTYRILGATGLSVSEAGFGAYRIDDSDEEHQKALYKALLSGINLIDTSSNYGDGRSEEIIGEVLNRLEMENRLRRDEVLIVTKAGYVQGKNLRHSRLRQAQGRPFAELVPFDPDLAHCIHPEFLEEQLTGSLNRLQVTTVDLFLLHNPEYYLKWVRHEGIPFDEARQEYLRRIETAFRYLEDEVKRGRIGAYGISSNSFPLPASDYEHTPLEALWHRACAIASDHHFRAVQFPLNLIEQRGVTEKNQPGKSSVLRFAQDTGMAVLTNRPLNAFIGNQLLRLAEVDIEEEKTAEAVKRCLVDLSRLEEHLALQILPVHKMAIGKANDIQAKLSASEMLDEQWLRFTNPIQWEEALARYIVPTIQDGMDLLLTHKWHRRPPEIVEWANEYAEALNKAFETITAVLQARAKEKTTMIKKHLEAVEPDWTGTDTISQTALRVLRSTAGVTTVLVGMRQRQYVDDVLVELNRSVIVKDREATWEQLASLAEGL